jgi:hypothetical protein
MTSETVRVRLPDNLGVRACGRYQAGVEYEVDADEAERLIKTKRFERVSNDEQET